MLAPPDSVTLGDVTYMKRNWMEDLPLFIDYPCIYPCICYIQFIRNKGHVFSDLA